MLPPQKHMVYPRINIYNANRYNNARNEFFICLHNFSAKEEQQQNYHKVYHTGMAMDFILDTL
jgi:hypothetical protein